MEIATENVEDGMDRKDLRSKRPKSIVYLASIFFFDPGGTAFFCRLECIFQTRCNAYCTLVSQTLNHCYFRVWVYILSWN